MFREGDKLLLGLKKQGFGEGRWNGFGGKLDAGETIEECAQRETREEIGVEIEAMEKFALMQFEFYGKPDVIEVHAFDVKKYSGEPKEIEKLIPQWFDIKDVPFRDMWPDDPFWYPLYLAGKKFKGQFSFDENGNEVRKVNLEIVGNV
ncbi:8-oxo-dGTP diphosphatase [Patescibacteria group bacterium]|nr:MAG: 8-oxo-dGTP diphosphatase [Patescibacteria group bacterium]